MPGYAVSAWLCCRSQWRQAGWPHGFRAVNLRTACVALHALSRVLCEKNNDVAVLLPTSEVKICVMSFSGFSVLICGLCHEENRSVGAADRKAEISGL